ncbi:hypothetical protein ACFROC_07065 [Nocardia tengchongensis]|uniref:hypothetical protein n=1 Tax=Nocardia tengchongensis TaxID=2055889 RepID=UPI0036808CE2
MSIAPPLRTTVLRNHFSPVSGASMPTMAAAGRVELTMDAAGAVLDQLVQLGRESAVGVGPSAVQIAFESATGAEEVAGDHGAITTDRQLVAGAARGEEGDRRRSQVC